MEGEARGRGKGEIAGNVFWQPNGQIQTFIGQKRIRKSRGKTAPCGTHGGVEIGDWRADCILERGVSCIE